MAQWRQSSGDGGNAEFGIDRDRKVKTGDGKRPEGGARRVERNKARPIVVMTTGRAVLSFRSPLFRYPVSRPLSYQHSSLPIHPRVDCCGAGFAISMAV